jgi:hypothetical protein
VGEKTLLVKGLKKWLMGKTCFETCFGGLG